MTWNKDRKQTKYGHMRREHMTHTTEPWHILVPKYYIFVPFKRCCCNSDSFCTFFSESVPNIGLSYCFFALLLVLYDVGLWQTEASMFWDDLLPCSTSLCESLQLSLTANDLLFQLQCFQMTHAYISSRLSRLTQDEVSLIHHLIIAAAVIARFLAFINKYNVLQNIYKTEHERLNVLLFSIQFM